MWATCVSTVGRNGSTPTTSCVWSGHRPSRNDLTAARGDLQDRCHQARSARRSARLNWLVVDARTEALEHLSSQNRWCCIFVEGRRRRAVAPQPVSNMPVLLEVVPQRDVDEGTAV